MQLMRFADPPSMPHFNNIHFRIVTYLYVHVFVRHIFRRKNYSKLNFKKEFVHRTIYILKHRDEPAIQQHFASRLREETTMCELISQLMKFAGSLDPTLGGRSSTPTFLPNSRISPVRFRWWESQEISQIKTSIHHGCPEVCTIQFSLLRRSALRLCGRIVSNFDGEKYCMEDIVECFHFLIYIF